MATIRISKVGVRGSPAGRLQTNEAVVRVKGCCTGLEICTELIYCHSKEQEDKVLAHKRQSLDDGTVG